MLKDFQGELAAYSINIEDNRIEISACSEKSKKQGQFLPMYSFRNPKRSVERILNKFYLRKGYLAVIMGSANIPLLEEVINQKQKNGGDVILFEADSVLIHEINLLKPELLKNIYIVTPANIDHLELIIESFNLEDLLGYRILNNPPSIQLALPNIESQQNFYHQIEFDFKKLFSSRFSDLFTRLQFEPRWIFNALQKISSFAETKAVSSLFSSAQNMQALLISTGPSLRLALPLIKAHQDKVFIVCVDSAYRILKRYGIKPHLIVSLDSQAFTLRHIAGLPMGKPNEFPILYADLVANPSVTKRWQGPLCYGITAQYLGVKDQVRVVTPGCDYIEDEILNLREHPQNSLGDIQSGGSVATSAFDLMRQMEFEKIYFVGQDLAYSYREIHCMGSHHVDHWFSEKTNRLNSIENINEAVLRKRQLEYKPSIKGKLVKADYVLSLYNDWFSAACERVPNWAINTSEEGLPIKNCTHTSLKECLDKIPKFEKEDFDAILQKYNQSKSILTKEESSLKLEKLNQDLLVKQRPQFFDNIGRKHYIASLRKPQQAEELNKKRKREQDKFTSKLLDRLFDNP